MNHIKYIWKRFWHMNWKNMGMIAGKVAKITGKSRFFIIKDMILCAKNYGAGYMDYFEFEFYLLNQEERKTYLTASMNNQIIAKYNEKEKRELFSDKIQFNEIFKTYLHHEFLDLRKCSWKEFEIFCQNKKKIVGKVIDSCGGKGIQIYSVSKDLKALYETLMKEKQYLVESQIVQHPKMDELYEGSVNTLRIISFLKDDGEVEILNTILRIGNGGCVDNFSSGGMYTFADENGKVLIPAIDEAGNVFEVHPITQTKIVGFQIPNFEQIKSFVKEIAKVIPEVRYVGWDVAVGEKEPILVEGNEYSGVFQMKPSLSKKKEGLLPKYRKYMDI